MCKLTFYLEEKCKTSEKNEVLCRRSSKVVQRLCQEAAPTVSAAVV